jgi:DNA-binding CsgD family transcriptional regulator/tetratricopeptide (TPR) repeat protein
VLIEREHTLGRLTALLEESAGGAGRLAFLGGEAGVGKTTVVTDIAGRATGSMTVRRGGCDAVAIGAALGPLVDAVPELADDIERVADADRLRLFRRLLSTLGATPTLLIIEDVHWADEATLDLLRFVGRRIADLPLLVVSTFRDDEVGPEHPLRLLLGDLATAPRVTRLALAPLSVTGVRQLLTAAGSPLDPAQLHRLTGGNPFYVSEVLAAGTPELPASVRDAVLARTAGLSDDARRVLGAAAVLGSPADLRLLTTVSEAPAAAVDECVRRGVLVGGADGWAFRHELARLAVEQTLLPATSAALHARALQALRAAGGQDDARLAHHAAAAGDGAAALEHASRAAVRAARLGAHREAAELYRLALRFADTPAACLPLLEALSYECYLTDRPDDSMTARREAMALSEQAGDQRAVGADLRWLSRLSWFLGRNAEAETYATRAVAVLEPVDDGHELAMAYSNVAHLRMLAGDTEEAVEWGERAIAFARRIGDREVEIHALNNMGTAYASRDDPRGRPLLQRSLELALAEDAHEHAARAYTNLGSEAVRNHHHREADRILREGIAYTEDRDLDSWALYSAAWLGRSLADQGRYAEADEQVAVVLRRPRVSPITRMTAEAVAGQLALRRDGVDRGHLERARALALPTGEEQRLVFVAVAGAEAAWLQGRLEDVEREVDRGWSSALEHRDGWGVGELAAWLAIAGVRRPVDLPVPRPFARLLAEDWRAAADEWLRLACPLWAAHALARSPDLGDARRALELLEGLGAPALQRALMRDRHSAGLAVPRGPRPASRANPSGLTARELEVLHLLAEGLSDAGIATRLYLSEKTVSHHVSAVLHKLGEPTRSRAVAAALRRRIITPA